MIGSAKVAQDPRSTFGKILEIDLDSLKSRTISLGHRNPQGIVITSTGDTLATEHGPSGGDELNKIVEGSNYGWPVETLGTDYGTYSWPNQPFTGEHAHFTLPMFAWVPSIGIGNLIQVRNFHRRWDGDLLVASMKAESLFRLRIDGNRVVYAEAIYVGERIRDIAQLRNGIVVLWTDDSKLLFYSVDEIKLRANKRAIEFYPPALSACMSCHHLGPTNSFHMAPTLTGLIGKRIASDSYERYSLALRSVGSTWTLPKLRSFIQNPGRFAPGSTMPALNLGEQDLESILAFLGRPDAGAAKSPERH
jgi:cytochrome c2